MDEPLKKCYGAYEEELNHECSWCSDSYWCMILTRKLKEAVIVPQDLDRFIRIVNSEENDE